MNNMESLLENSRLDNLKEGSIISAKIIGIRRHEIIVDIGGKSEGTILIKEFSNIKTLEVGNEIEVFLEKIEDKNGSPVISYEKAEQKKNWKNILEQNKEGTIVTGKVKSKVKGGLIVNIGVDSFLPASQIDIQPPQNLDQYIGQTFDFKILKINIDRRNIIISRRELIEEERAKKCKNLLSKISKGSILRGIVKNITDYGAFIDLDGLDGLLHITDISWGRISHPSEVLKIGEEIDVMVTDINKERERVSLGIKQMNENPWENIELRYPLGVKVYGKVVNIVPYGAFIELENGVEGLIHITELSWVKRVNKFNEVLKIGEIIESIVIGIQKEDQKISLSIRHLKENPWKIVSNNYSIGTIVKGKVQNFTNYGVFIELENGIDGMIHISDISWTRKINHPSEVFNKEDLIEAIVLDIDTDNQRIALGIKQLEKDPWENIDSNYKIGDIVVGKINKITSYGAFIQMKNHIDGFVHISQISEDRIENINVVLEQNTTVTARVIKIDKHERKISLSIKAASYDKKKFNALVEDFKDLNSNEREEAELTNLGDILAGVTN